jgi:putative spermidine/putrescine transport system permease protein
LYLLPGLLFVFVFIGYGLLQAFLESITDYNTQTVTFEHYVRLFEQRAFWDSLVFSVQVTMISTVISLAVGIFVTKILYQYLLENYLRQFVWLPMLFPHFVAGYMILLLFSQGGWFSSATYSLNLINEPSQFPILIMDRQGIGIILTYVWKEIPFVVLMLLPVYYQIDSRYEDVVKTLGGGKWQTFITVEWRWLLPVVLETGLIIFAFILAAFEVPYLLGVTYPKMLPVLAYQWFFEGDWSNRPLAMASMILLTVIIVTVAFIVLSMIQKMRYRMMRGN